MMKEQ